MIEIKDAFLKVEHHTPTLNPIMVSVEDSLFSVLSKDVISPIDMPPFNQSAMDGYALFYDAAIEQYKLIGETQAGNEKTIELKKGDAIKIFTGAPVPHSANTVIQKEWVNESKGKIQFIKNIKSGLNIRPKGEQIQKNEIAVQKNTKITPATIGFFNTLGITQIEVYRKPKVWVAATGNELIQPGKKLSFGKIYESNSNMICGALKESKVKNIEKIVIKDDYTATLNHINSALKNNDLLILTGGISVGDYDFVGKALRELEVEEIFYKVNQKPGKPLFFGKKENTLIFALPGNPAAALTCFYLYILPSINKMMGKGFKGLKKISAPLEKEYQKTESRGEFLKAIHKNDQITLLGGQSSAMLQSFSEANALAFFPVGESFFKKGQLIDLYLLND